MKHSIDYSPQNETVMPYDLCSEKSCATCFENRGCIYEQHLFAAILNMDVVQMERQMKNASPRPINGHTIIPAGVAA